MLDKKYYSNDHKTHEFIGNNFTWYYKNGQVKAEEIYIDGLMEGE